MQWRRLCERWSQCPRMHRGCTSQSHGRDFARLVRDGRDAERDDDDDVGGGISVKLFEQSAPVMSR